MANEFRIKNGFRSEGNSEITGSLIVSNSLDTAQGKLYYANGTSSINYKSGLLYDDFGVPSADYRDTRELFDYVESSSLNWGNRQLIKTDGSVTVDWENAIITASLQGTASWAENATTASFYQETDPIFIAKSGSFATTGSNLFIGTQQISGSLQLNPTQDPGGSNTTSSFLFVTSSGDNTEYNLHYRNNGALWETHWLEERVDTGIVWGGILTFTNTTMSITPGAGLIVNHNANTGSHGDTIPTYVQFGPITASATFITSSQVTYLLIDETGNLIQQTSPFTPQQYNEKLPLGYIFSLTTSSISSYADARVTTYGQDEQQSQFIRAFGPLKVSGYDLTAQSGSLKISIAAGRTYRNGGFYTQDPDNPSIYDSTAIATGSLVRIYRDPAVVGGFRAATNAGVPYTDIDPTKWDNGSGTLQTVGANEWSIQRIFQGVVNNISYVYYGQNTYDSLNAAIQSITTEPFDESPTSIVALPFIGYIITRGNTIDIGDTTNNKLINSGLFRNTAGSSGGGGVATTNLNDLADVVITSPTNGTALIYNAGQWINGTPLNATSASFATTASYVLNAVSSSFATTASYVAAAGNNNEIQYNSNGSFASTASFAFIHASESLQQGSSVIASGSYSHAEGASTVAVGEASHAEGFGTQTIGNYSHAEGYQTKTGGNNGYLATSIINGTASLSASYGDRQYDYPAGNYLYLNDADYDFIYGGDIFIILSASFNGTYTEIFIDNTVNTTTAVVGNLTTGVNGWLGEQTYGSNLSHAEGAGTVTILDRSHAEGSAAVAAGFASHAEGYLTTTIGSYSHAEGYQTIASGDSSHAEGESTIASGFASHAEGSSAIASGAHSHAEGRGTIALGDYSHAEGNETIASGSYQHVSGKYNTHGNTTSLFIIGNGVNPSTRSDLALFNADGIVFNQPVTASIVSASFIGNLTGTASYATQALSASWAPGGVTINNNVNDYIITATGTANTLNGESKLSFNGSILTVTGSITADSISGSLTGSLLGTASTASFVTASNVYGPYGSNSVLSASFAVSASWAPGGGGVTINNNTDNYLVTATGTANTLNGESGLTYDGTTFTVGSAIRFVQGTNSTATVAGAFVHGNQATGSGLYSHAEGFKTQTLASSAHAEGALTIAIGAASHAEGSASVSFGAFSHADGIATIASGSGQFVTGKFNQHGDATSLFIVGNGANDSTRSDIFRITDTSVQVTGSLNVTAGITGSLQGTATSASFASTASYVNGMITKNNAVAGGSFAGNPKKATVTFATAFPNTNYSVTVTGEDARSWTIESKLAGSFVINSNSNTALANTVYWQAISYGEFNG